MGRDFRGSHQSRARPLHDSCLPVALPAFAAPDLNRTLDKHAH